MTGSRRHHPGRLITVALLAAAALLLTFLVQAGTIQSAIVPVRQEAYRLVRGVNHYRELHGVQGWPTVQEAHVTLYYPPGHLSQAQEVAKLAEADYLRVGHDLGFMPSGKVPIIMRPSGRALDQAVGLRSDEQAEGFYWDGVVQVVSPQALDPTLSGNKQLKTYSKTGPVAHELTHYVFDAMTSGNYPVWYTEGLAQYEEYRIDNWQWIEGNGDIRADLLSPAQLTHHFDAAPDIAVAYREAFLLVRFMVQEKGASSIHALNVRLQHGQSFSAAFQAVTGHTLAGWWPQYKQWLNTHWQAS